VKTIFKDGLVTLQALKAADNEALEGSGVDMAGFEGVTFIAGALKGEALDFSIKAQQDSASDYSTAADLEGTAKAFSTTIAADSVVTLEIVKPRERYVRPVITVPNASAATPTFCVAIRWGARVMPQTNAGEQHISPAEGTA
jgi:hypothetical protein